MGVGDQQVTNKVLIARSHSALAGAAAALHPVLSHRGALDVVRVGERDRLVLFGHQIEQRHITRALGDHRAAGIPEAIANRDELFGDHAHEHALIAEDALEVRDILKQPCVFVFDLVALHAGQALQAHVKDGLGLDLGKSESGDQAFSGDVYRTSGADDPDDLVDIVERKTETLENVRAIIGLTQPVAGAAQRDLAPMCEVELQHLLERQHPGPLLYDRQQDHPEGALQGRVLPQVIEHDFAHCIVL